MILNILSDKEGFLDLVTERLGAVPIDFGKKAQRLTTEQAWRAAGVLLPLVYRDRGPADTEKGFRVILIKRSTRVVQAGDLSCPGGMLHPYLDPLFRPLIAHGLVPFLGGKALARAKSRGRSEFKRITLFLTSALRESWEEINLNPFRVRFLGPLPSCDLVMFKRTVFPLVGFVEGGGSLRPNREVESIVRIPLSFFFDRERFAVYTVKAIGEFGEVIGEGGPYPCFVHVTESGVEEVLWGATFSIIESFVKTVFDREFPPPSSSKKITKVIRVVP